MTAKVKAMKDGPEKKKAQQKQLALMQKVQQMK